MNVNAHWECPVGRAHPTSPSSGSCKYFPEIFTEVINELKKHVVISSLNTMHLYRFRCLKIVGKRTSHALKTSASALLGAGLLMAPPALADGFGISQVKETVRPFNELNPSGQRRFAVGLCKDAAALKKAGFGSYPECAQLPSSKAITASLRERER